MGFYAQTASVMFSSGTRQVNDRARIKLGNTIQLMNAEIKPKLSMIVAKVNEKKQREILIILSVFLVLFFIGMRN